MNPIMEQLFNNKWINIIEHTNTSKLYIYTQIMLKVISINIVNFKKYIFNNLRIDEAEFYLPKKKIQIIIFFFKQFYK